MKKVTTSVPPAPKLYACRQTTEADIPGIYALQTPVSKYMFGEIDVKNCIEKCVCKTLLNVEQEVVAFIVLTDHPNIPVLQYCSWTGWIKQYYRLYDATPWNTRFIHYIVWDNMYPRFLTQMLKTIYKNNVKLQQIILVVPPGILISPELEYMFTPVYPKGGGVVGTTFIHCQTLYLNLRHRVLSKLIIRKAGEEDNIDVQPLLHHQLDVLKYIFGEFRLGKVIDLNNPTKCVLVAEKTPSVTVGMISVTTNVDYSHIDFYFHHLLFRSDREVRQDTIRSDLRRGMTFLEEPMMIDEDLTSMNLETESVQAEEPKAEEEEEQEERDELMVYWDEDGDVFRIVDPLMEFLFVNRKKAVAEHVEKEDDTIRDSISSKLSSLDYTYWGRPSFTYNMNPSMFTSTLVGESRSTTFRENRENTLFSEAAAVELFPENAYVISLFALHPDLDKRYGYDILEASFECFPDKQICLLAMPTAYQGSPLTQHMVRLIPKLSRDYPHELFAIHRNSVFSDFSVRPISLVDHLSILELVETLSFGKKIRQTIASMVNEVNHGLLGYVLECEGCIVGVAIVSVNYGLFQMHPHFKIDEIINKRLYGYDCHGLLRHLVLCPTFLRADTFFLRQIMHQSGVETLSYCLLHEEDVNEFHLDVSPVTVLGELTPVRPRKRIQYDLPSLDIYKPEAHVLKQEFDFALFVTCDRLLSIPKLELNFRLIVVGASSTAISFLENLIFRAAKRHVRYTSITLISVHGFPLELKPHVAGDKMLPHNGVHTREYLTRISLPTHVNVMYGALTVINRKDKMICLNDDQWMRYDYLFLFTGTQFCKPWPFLDSRRNTTTRVSTNRSSGKTSSMPSSSDKPSTTVPRRISSTKQDSTRLPNSNNNCKKNEDLRDMYIRAEREYGDNLFTVNTPADAIVSLGQLKKIIKSKKQVGKILVYGNSINIFSCIESLMTFGVPGSMIVLIISPQSCPVRSMEFFPIVEKTVFQILTQSDVTIHKGYTLVRWNLRHKYLQKVLFTNEANNPLILDCLALFCFGTKVTNSKTYLAINEAGLVFNNGIIINNKFRTNDEYIFAAGPGTRYSKHLHPTDVDHHMYYNSIEVGLQASRIFCQLVEPPIKIQDMKPRPSSVEISKRVSQNSQEPSGDYLGDSPWDHPEEQGLPILTEPTVLVAHLPGGWNFVRVTAPGRPIPLECQLHGQADTGPVLITGVPIKADGPGYFRISFTIYNTVREIVLFSKKPIPDGNIRHLYGKHEKVLNNLYEHYNQGLIPDFYSYFNQPWAYALYTTRFNDLILQCAEIFTTDDSIAIPHLNNLAKDEINNVLNNMDLDAIGQKYTASSVPLYVEHLTLKFVSERKLQLPMYFNDAVLNSMYRTYSTSPLHREQLKSRARFRSERDRSDRSEASSVRSDATGTDRSERTGTEASERTGTELSVLTGTERAGTDHSKRTGTDLSKRTGTEISDYSNQTPPEGMIPLGHQIPSYSQMS